MLIPPADHKAEAVRILTARRESTLLVLPKWRTLPDGEHPAWVTKTGLIGVQQAARPLPSAGVLSRRPGPSRPVLRMVPEGSLTGVWTSTRAVDDLQTMGPSAVWRPVLVDEAGKAVLARRAGGDLYVLADPDVIDTIALEDGAVARMAATLFDSLRRGDPVVFDVTLDGLGERRSLLRLRPRVVRLPQAAARARAPEEARQQIGCGVDALSTAASFLGATSAAADVFARADEPPDYRRDGRARPRAVDRHRQRGWPRGPARPRRRHLGR